LREEGQNVERHGASRNFGLIVALACVVGLSVAAWLVAKGPPAPPRVRVVAPQARRTVVPAAATSGEPAKSFVAPVSPSTVPAPGEATQYGCSAALVYLHAYAAPGFRLRCPGNADGHQATTMCWTSASPCDAGQLIVIADPCPAAYMNEAANSWVLLGLSGAPLDPYGACA
jgi:hypothetical protein